MKIRITIPQIRCRKITFPRTAKDEIYLGYFITLAKTNNKKGTAEVRKYVSKKISNIQKHV
ncbi:MAG: hypothetical protein KAS32_04680, partial [Candidatus Peribacteraceae bacterium]|nr:hypothetical protein [Candidatus Peribacteraceae bacterium]